MYFRNTGQEGMGEAAAQHSDIRRIFDQVGQHERAEIALYRDIARSAPSRCLRRKITVMAEMEAHHAQVYAQVAADYGLAAEGYPSGPPLPTIPPPHVYGQGEKK